MGKLVWSGCAASKEDVQYAPGSWDKYLGGVCLKGQRRNGQLGSSSVKFFAGFILLHTWNPNISVMVMGGAGGEGKLLVGISKNIPFILLCEELFWIWVFWGLQKVAHHSFKFFPFIFTGPCCIFIGFINSFFPISFKNYCVFVEPLVLKLVQYLKCHFCPGLLIMHELVPYIMNFESNDSQQAFSMGSPYIMWKAYNSHHQADLVFYSREGRGHW